MNSLSLTFNTQVILENRASLLLYLYWRALISSITTLLVKFGRLFSFSSTAISYTDFVSLVPPDKRCYDLCREERALLRTWGKRLKCMKLAALGFTRREVWADFQDFWSNLTYFCKNHGEFVKYNVLEMCRVNDMANNSLTPKVLPENQWQLHWLSVEKEFNTFSTGNVTIKVLARHPSTHHCRRANYSQDGQN